MSVEWVGGGLAAAITVLGSWLVARTSARSTQRVAEKNVAGQIESSRAMAEENAYERAKRFYEGVIERQDREREQDHAEIRDLKADVTSLKAENARQAAQLRDQDERLAECRRACRALARRAGGPIPPEIEES